jgi:hypothetical protein
MDAMSDAVDNAEVMLSCISLAYKESASKLRSTFVVHAAAAACHVLLTDARVRRC